MTTKNLIILIDCKRIQQVILYFKCYIYFFLFSGTTALVAIVYKNKLIVANVGDSRGVICDSKGNTIPLSFDHKPDQVSELDIGS